MDGNSLSKAQPILGEYYQILSNELTNSITQFTVFHIQSNQGLHANGMQLFYNKFFHLVLLTMQSWANYLYWSGQKI